ncbi:MAG: trehalose-phosphatase [Anaerolineae bacterium]
MKKAIDYLLAGQPLALATDFDGTLSAITPTPQLARIHPKCRDSLAKLRNDLAWVAVLSGRQVEEVRQLVGLPGVVYLGNHGLERWEKGAKHIDPRASRYAPVIHSILERTRQELKLPGLLFEDKGIIASIHYRSAQDPVAARKRIASLLWDLAREPGLKVLEGRRVVELRPPLDLNKGTALLNLLRKYDVRGVIYAGDDKTDLDAFRAIHRWGIQEERRALAVGVISPEMPHGLMEDSDLVVEGVKGVAEFLAILAEAFSRNQ